MSRIVRAANVMIAHADKISNVIPNEGEYYFLYDGRYKWSTNRIQSTNDYVLRYYAGEETIEVLAGMSAEAWNNYDKFISYLTTDLKTREARETFQELYVLVKEKAFGIDNAINDILRGEPEDEVF